MNRLKYIRMERHMTQEELSKRSGVSRITIVRIESNTMNTTLRVMKRIADVLGCTVDDLIAEDGHEQGQASA